MWTRDAAQMVGLAESTVRTYLSSGRFPPPDGVESMRPWWRRSTIAGWLQDRRTDGRPRDAEVAVARNRLRSINGAVTRAVKAAHAEGVTVHGIATVLRMSRAEVQRRIDE